MAVLILLSSIIAIIILSKTKSSFFQNINIKQF